MDFRFTQEQDRWREEIRHLIISRYVVDAQVLPIFEGVKPILELKVVGRALLAG